MYEDLEPIAGLRHGATVEPIMREMQKNLSEAIEHFGARGLARSGPLEAEKLRIRVAASERACRALYEIWLDLITRRQGRITREDIAFIMAKVEGISIAHAKGMQGAHGESIMGANWWTQQSQERMQAVVSHIRRELEIKIREQEAFPTKVIKSSEEVFIIVAAFEDLQTLIDEAIVPAVKDNALNPFVMVTREPEGPIGNEILARIESARLVIADLTHERQNCYYGVGYAHAMGKKVIFTVRKDHDPRRVGRTASDPKIHFD
jgi:hypothetical protein